MANVTISDALDSLSASLVGQRRRGLENLRHILRHNQNSGKIESLGDDSFHAVFDALFQAALKEKSQVVKGTSESTRSAAASRLVDVAATLRQWIEAGARYLTKVKTVRAVYSHIIDTICFDTPNDAFCEPLALDYAKCLRALFSHQPHVERLGDDWQGNVDFAISCMGKLLEHNRDIAEAGSTIGTTNSLSHRSSRSGIRESSGSQGTRSALRLLMPEMMASLHLLTLAPNVPMEIRGHDILKSVVEFLQSSAMAAAAIQDAFRTINHVLWWSRTEAISLTKEHSSALLRIIAQFWPSKTNARDQMTVSLLLLRPFFVREMQLSPAPALRREVASLLHVLWSEYSKRQDRDRLNLEDLRFRINACPDLASGEVGTGMFELRCTGPRAEAQWLLLSIMASMYNGLADTSGGHTNASDMHRVDEDDPNPRSRKRQRAEDHFADLIRNISIGSWQSRTSATQILIFLTQDQKMSCGQVSKALSHLTASCSDDNGTTAAWALLAITSLASQACSTEPRLASSWAVFWQIACRSLSNATLCRPACYALHVMINLNLVSHASLSDLVQAITNAMDVSGPSQLSDAASLFLASIIRVAYQMHPGTAGMTAESIAQWVTRAILPARFEDKHFALSTSIYDVCDAMQLISECLNQATPSMIATRVRVWDELARAWLLCDQHAPLITYLLLDGSPQSVLHQSLSDAHRLSARASGTSPLTCEATILVHFVTELTKTTTAWAVLQQERRHVNLDSFTMLCKTACLMCTLVTGLQFRDVHRSSQLRDQAMTLLDALGDFVSSPGCDDAKSDAFLLGLSSALDGLSLCWAQHDEDTPNGSDFNHVPSECEKLVSRALDQMTEARRSLTQESMNQDTMDLDEEFESQSSSKGPQSTDVPVLSNDLEVRFGKPAMRQNVALYTRAIVIKEDEQVDGAPQSDSTWVIDYLEDFPTSIFLCRDVIKFLPRLGVDMTASDVHRLLENLMRMTKRPMYARSEVSLGACLDVLLSQANLWMDPSDDALYKLGLDLYDWWTVGQLGQGTMSSNIQKRLADLLVRLCQVQEDYAADEPDASTPRTSLFKLLSQGRITLQFHLADKIPKIFRSFVLATHEMIFDDLQSSLSEDITAFEGIALRHLILANLGSEWPSLLRRCVYYIFDAAGRATGSAAHATLCVERLAKRLPLQTPQRLFSLFAPQLLYTWLDCKYPLTSLPFATFQYNALKELLVSNEAEISAQLVLHDSPSDFKVMADALDIPVTELLSRSYPKALAYAIGRDISVAPGKPLAEKRLQTWLGGKGEAQTLTAAGFPTIMGYLYLIMQQDDVEDKWLAKNQAYAHEYGILTEIKKHGSSPRQLPRSQQPSYPSSHFLEQVERLSRRLSASEGTPWDSSSFAMVARMLLNAIDASLGPLHTSLIIRRLRALVSLARDVALQGFGLEMVINSLRHFISEPECADDVLGILWYLFNRGRAHLSQRLPFLRGAVLLLILGMRRHSRAKPDHMTQQRQHKATLENMEHFQSWLVEYLREALAAAPGSSDHDLVEALGPLQLPGNARKDSAESCLLLYILDQRRLAEPLCSRPDTLEAISLLSEDFDPPQSVTEDCLGDDIAAAHYSTELWHAVQEASPSEQLITWAAQVIGRAYASTGVRPSPTSSRPLSTSEVRIIEDVQEHGQIIRWSQYVIARRISDLMLSRDREEAGLADLCLRSYFELPCDHAEETTAFEQMLSASVIEATRHGSFRYRPAFAHRPRSASDSGIKALNEGLKSSSSLPLDEWATTLASNLCSCITRLPEVQMLGAMFRTPTTLAVELLPSMIHLLLYREAGQAMPVRAALSSAAAACLSQTEASAHPKQRFFLELLVYLRAQPYPSENSRADRLRWLGIDCLLAAKAAARCGKPTAALFFAEQEVPIAITGSNKRSSARTSLSQATKRQISDALLLAVYEQIEEPDSFYGVEQPASLATVLNRLDHEADGFKTLMFRSAQMDSDMRNAQHKAGAISVGMVHSLCNLSFNSLTLTLLQNSASGADASPDDILHAARALQRWDVTIPQARDAPGSAVFGALQELSRATHLEHIQSRLRSAVVTHARHGMHADKGIVPSYAWFAALAQLTELWELLTSSSHNQIADQWQMLQARKAWTDLAKFEDASPIVSNRQTFFGILRRNPGMQELLHLSSQHSLAFEAEALLNASKFAREHARLQEALTAVTSLTDMSGQFKAMGLSLEGAVKQETASVLWDAGEAAASVKMIRDVLAIDDLDKQDLAIGRAGLYAQLGHQLAEARLEKPEDILSRYLKPAISYLNKQKQGEEAGQVYHEFATFCDNELQSASNKEGLERIVKNRQGKEKEVDALELAMKNHKRAGGDRSEIMKSLGAARRWLEIDCAEEKRLFKERRMYIHQSLQNYLLALQASDSHDLDMLRFFALWLENCEDEEANSIALRYIRDVPSWKFVLLMNQLMSRVGDEKSTFQTALQQLLVRICGEHPHHSLHHLFAARSKAGSDPAAISRYNAANEMYRELARSPHKAMVDNIFKMDSISDSIANWHHPDRSIQKTSIRDCSHAVNLAHYMPKMRLPPVTMTIPLRPGGVYDDVPVVTKYDSKMRVMSGNSAPKALACRASDGLEYKQLFKDGDDLRQDAIMEQVFEEVSKMLRNHRATGQRDLKVRTYKVIPLSSRSGIIEFVPDSTPLNDVLRPAHRTYYPSDWDSGRARGVIDTAFKQGKSVEERVREYRKVCENVHPVLRHFFFENFNDPDEWFHKRTAYTRTTASISILGYILGLGDRHNSNIMLDKKTGEVVHIDLGVAFEAGRVLPIPELIPFRLTRDIVDGFGVTKTEGVFRRCCEFTLDAVREDKGSIMTLLNVLRYDPLYSWQSNTRAKRMQEAQGGGGGRGGPGEAESSGKKREQEAGEADRALGIVEKKLSQTLSTAATVNELIQQAMDERNLGTLFCGWAAWW